MNRASIPVPAIVADGDTLRQRVTAAARGEPITPADIDALVSKYVTPVMFGAKHGSSSTGLGSGGLGTVQYQNDGTRVLAVVLLSDLLAKSQRFDLLASLFESICSQGPKRLPLFPGISGSFSEAS